MITAKHSHQAADADVAAEVARLTHGEGVDV